MRMTRGDGSKYQTMHNGRRQWCWKWKQAGKYRRVYADGLQELSEKHTARVIALANAPELKPSRRREPAKATRANPTVDMAFETYLAHADIADSTRTRYRNNYRNHVKPLIGGILIRRLTASQIQAAFDHMASHDTGESAIWHVWVGVNAFMNWCVKQAIIKRNPMDSLTKPRKTTKVKYYDDTYADQHELTVIGIINWLAMPSCPYHFYYPLVMMMNLGLRRAELLGLTREAINQSSRVLTINAQLEQRRGGAYLKAGNKGRSGDVRSRLIPIPQPHMQALSQQLRKHEHDPQAGLITVEQDGKAIDTRHLVFIRDDGKPYTYNDYNTIWRNIQTDYKRHVLGDETPLTKAEYIRPHANRHIACSLLAQQGVELPMIQAILGHLTPAMTEHYMHITMASRLDIADKYGADMTNAIMKNFVSESTKMNA